MESTLLANADFGLDPSVTFYQDSHGLKFLEIENEHCTAKMAMQGAHVMTWQPKHEKASVLWLSDHARYIHGRSIRGGVPVCWPWFGPHPTDSTLCPHGFARVMPWQLQETQMLENGATRIVMQILNTPVAQKQLSYPYVLKLIAEFGETLKIELATTNKGNHPFMIGEAFHTYFQISDIENISIDGLEGVEFSDKVQNYERDSQVGDIRFNGEFDRVYVNSKADCVIKDPGLHRAIRISKQGSNSTVIWTPWEEKAHALGDMGTDDSWRHTICVESANALENLVNVNPGQTHVLAVEYSTEAL